jgi:amino-acid N-acetyltransferase
MGAFLLASHQGRPVGMIGLQAYSDIGLLRSLIVGEECRGKGLAADLIAALETKAVADGMSELWLLTMDADAFFTRHGYEIKQRVAAPAAIQNSAEFSSLCPGDAVLMRKRLPCV